ncbi:hypothetical protein LCGC14_1815970 [marine sediment metagenome]|uniref:Uncharacterized protein n=1 Tax=marine sediment metagenome TaxID=412755 RepID=A0A0F9GKH2_9ZZZZ
MSAIQGEREADGGCPGVVLGRRRIRGSGCRGEDEEGDTGVYGGDSLDYVVTRTTCYSAGTLFRLSGQGTGAGFSVFGL